LLLASLALAVTQPALAPAPVRAAAVPCNPDPLKGAACHAHREQARAEARSQQTAPAD